MSVEGKILYRINRNKAGSARCRPCVNTIDKDKYVRIKRIDFSDVIFYADFHGKRRDVTSVQNIPADINPCTIILFKHIAYTHKKDVFIPA